MISHLYSFSYTAALERQTLMLDMAKRTNIFVLLVTPKTVTNIGPDQFPNL